MKGSLLISQATFLQNFAQLGGGIYLGDQSIIVDSSSFIENNALQGGAITTLTSSNFFRDNRIKPLNRQDNNG